MEGKGKRKVGLLLVVVALAAAFVMWYGIREKNAAKTLLSERPTESASDAAEASEDIYVHITGEVAKPGVLTLPAGARLIDAVEAAGGMTAEADSDSVNLASVLEDEDKIVIPAKEDAAATAPGVSAEGKVNLNTATLEELKTLNGVGDVIGQNIIDYREANGGFKSIEELMEVDRIGEKLFEKLRDNIVI